MSNIMFFQRFTLFRRLLRHSVPRNDKLVFQKSGEESDSRHIDNINIMGIFKKAEEGLKWLKMAIKGKV